jgi:hypothetical protein
MFDLIASGANLIFPGARALKLVKAGVTVTNSTNPLVLAKNITLTVLDCCAPPPVSLAFHCISAVALIGASIAAPNPVTVGSSIHLVSELYDRC